jgi:hypothetical protein
MDKEYTKIFTNSTLIINGLTVILEEKNINYIIKDRFKSAIMAGFGETPNSTELHVDSSKLEMALKILENYKETINS